VNTTTSRSLQWLRRNGWIAQVVEQNIRYPDKEHPGKMKMFKRDLWNVADLVAIKDKNPSGTENGVLFVQTTTTAHQAERMAKIEGIPAAYQMLKTKNRLQIHGWARKGARGKRKLWQVTVTEVLLKENGLLAFVSRAEDAVEDDSKPAENLFGPAGEIPQQAADSDW